VNYRVTGGPWGSIKVNGEWIPVDKDRILDRVSAPDGGAHACFPKEAKTSKDMYCVVLPPFAYNNKGIFDVVVLE
jgi:hypothetical protein